MNSKNLWQVHVPRRVARAVSRLPKSDQDRILEILREFEIDPWAGDIVKIKDEENKWRRRVGNYRLFYSIYSALKLVEVKEIQRRGSKTY